MRILRIHIQNLNSLRGEHLIDFTVAPLADHPLYAIVGPTGAGKTTILDAITLALYGLTERTKDATEASKEVATVMTHGTARCRAEVEFETGGARYRSVWRRRRAHKKVTNDLMSSEREIGKYDPQTESYQILATKKREVSEITERVVGLDYDRFVRSVMLTQGDFDRFLKSKPGEKAAILEQITGTAIYRDLSEGAFLRYKQAREAYERATGQLQHALPLSKEARQTLEGQIEEQVARSQDLSKAIQQLTQKLACYGEVTTLSEKILPAEKKQLSALQAWELLAEDRNALAQNDRVDPLRSAIQEADKIDVEQQRDRQTLVTAQTALGELANTKELNLAATVLARQKLATYLGGATSRKTVLDRAEQLEQEITLTDRDRRREASELTLHLRSRQELQQQLDRLEVSLTELRNKLGGRGAETLESELQELEQKAPLAEEEIATVERGITYREVEQRLLAAEQQENTLKTEIAKIQQELEAERGAVAIATKDVEMQVLRLENARLHAQVSEHRDKLTAGVPCPLCGSVHHPYLKDGPVESTGEVRMVQNELTRVQNELTRVDNALGLTLKKEQNVRERNAALSGLLTELKGQLLPPKPAVSLEELRRTRSELIIKQKERQAKLLQLRGLRASIPELNRQQLVQEGTRKKMGELQLLSNKLRESVEQRENLISERKRMLFTLLGGSDSAAILRQRQAEEQEKLRKEKESAEGRENAAITELTVAEERRNLLGERIETRSLRITNLLNELGIELEKLALTREQARALLLLPEGISIIRQRVQDARQEMITSEAMLKDLVNAHEVAVAALEGLPEESEAKATRATLTEELTAVERTIGGLEEQRSEDNKRTERTAALLDELQLLEKERDRWAAMNELIGSADGKKFRSFAQSITLQRLVDMGNDHLETISPRYRMQYAPPPPGGKEELELEIVDNYMNDNRRTMSTLSGGETFLVSLALALGLSDLASGKQLIQSLFIDEGFGTLDGKTLDQAMATLEQLQAQGKTIGIISHVQQLRERVVCQIQLEPVGDGFSRIALIN